MRALKEAIAYSYPHGATHDHPWSAFPTVWESGMSRRTSRVKTVADCYCQVDHEQTMNECLFDFLNGNGHDNEVPSTNPNNGATFLFRLHNVFNANTVNCLVVDTKRPMFCSRLQQPLRFRLAFFFTVLKAGLFFFNLSVIGSDYRTSQAF